MSEVDPSIREMLSTMRMEQQGIMSTIPLPWPRLSAHTSALKPGCAAVIAGHQGCGKSYLTTAIALNTHELGETWTYLPLEDNKQSFMRRILAIKEEDFSMTQDDPEGAEKRILALKKHRAYLTDVAQHVQENPRVPVTMSDGSVEVPSYTDKDCLEWLIKNAPKYRVMFIDNITQIDFTGFKQYEAEADFARKALGLVQHYKSTIVFVAHMQGRGGVSAKTKFTIEDIAGSTMWRKLIQTVLIMTAHEEREERVYCAGGYTGDVNQKDVEHNVTMLMGKTRDDKGSNKSMAFSKSATSPAFEEHGLIVPTCKRKDI